MSGIAGSFVGFYCREIDAPDKPLARGINKITVLCRKCRVLQGEESPREVSLREIAAATAILARNLFIRLDLNDVAHSR